MVESGPVEEPVPDGQGFGRTLEPGDIRAGEFKRASAMMTLGELAGMGARFPSDRFRRRCWVIIWNRLAFPLANVILCLLALPLVFRQTGQVALVGIALAVLVGLLYFAANAISIDLAYRGWLLWRWPPLAGASPTVLFGGIAAWMFARMERV